MLDEKEKIFIKEIFLDDTINKKQIKEMEIDARKKMEPFWSSLYNFVVDRRLSAIKEDDPLLENFLFSIAPSCVYPRSSDVEMSMHFYCQLCEMKYKKTPYIVRHYREKHFHDMPENILGTLTIFMCEICNTGFNRKEYYNLHLNSESHKNALDPQREGPNVEKKNHNKERRENEISLWESKRHKGDDLINDNIAEKGEQSQELESETPSKQSLTKNLPKRSDSNIINNVCPNNTVNESDSDSILSEDDNLFLNLQKKELNKNQCKISEDLSVSSEKISMDKIINNKNIESEKIDKNNENKEDCLKRIQEKPFVLSSSPNASQEVLVVSLKTDNLKKQVSSDSAERNLMNELAILLADDDEEKNENSSKCDKDIEKNRACLLTKKSLQEVELNGKEIVRVLSQKLEKKLSFIN
jgi:hypothetical protein